MSAQRTAAFSPSPDSSSPARANKPWGFAGQSLIEYAVLLVVLIAALVAMGGYAKRAFSGRVRGAADSVGEQYDPRKTTGRLRQTSRGTTLTTALTLNEPQLLSSPFCHDDCSCADLNEDGDCEDERIFGTVTIAQIPEQSPEVTEREGEETVGALGTNLWD